MRKTHANAAMINKRVPKRTAICIMLESRRFARHHDLGHRLGRLLFRKEINIMKSAVTHDPV